MNQMNGSETSSFEAFTTPEMPVQPVTVNGHADVQHPLMDALRDMSPENRAIFENMRTNREAIRAAARRIR